ncbi:hypothetical protein BGX38DRAFT_1141401 [Terfezia claveryi]|nr:hypothetical protein BGX38DRAFT_1141401 [Terfezia claveryi]
MYLRLWGFLWEFASMKRISAHASPCQNCFLNLRDIHAQAFAPASRQQPGQPDQHPEAMAGLQERLDPNRPVQPINCSMTSITCGDFGRANSQQAERIYKSYRNH